MQHPHKESLNLIKNKKENLEYTKVGVIIEHNLY